MKIKKWYATINVVILLTSVLLFMFVNSGDEAIWRGSSVWSILIMLIIAVLVHVVKVIRLYLVLYGNAVSWTEHLKQYCKVIPVSMILPFKLGEIFRIYCYGYQLENYFKGLVVILLDRFMDTLALVTLFFFINVISRAWFTLIFYILMGVLITIMICYLLFPGTYSYWKGYFLKIRASKQNIRLLKIMDKMNEAYSEITVLLKGRSAILYSLSLAAWIVEISGLLLCNRVLGFSQTTTVMSEYLSATLWGNESVYLKQFILISIVLMLTVYLFVRFKSLCKGKGEGKC